MGFWFALFLFVGSTVVSALLQRRAEQLEPTSEGDFRRPTTQDGRVVPWVCGTVKISGPNVVWWGDYKTTAIKKSTGFLGLGGKQTVGYYYSASMMFVLCGGQVDALVQVLGDDKPADFTLGGTSGSVNDPDLFGGKEKEGGLVGAFEFYPGSDAQAASAFLTSKWGSPAPTFRKISYAVFKNFNFGTSGYIKPLGFVVRRTPNGIGLSGGKQNINGDANPACMIYDLMTDERLGLGEPPSRFDVSSFVAAGNTLYDEGFGLSMMVDNEGSADQILADILRHIDGVLYTDPSTGLWTLKLARADYDVEELPVFGEAEVLEARDYTRASWDDTINKLKVSYVDRAAGFVERTVQAFESANHATQQLIANDTATYKGITNATLAQFVAMRDLKSASYPLAQVSLTLNRAGWVLRPGAPFVWNWPPLGIEGMVLRVTEINYGALEAGEITVRAVEDIFAIAGTAFTPPGESEWEDPIGPPEPPAAQALLEAPYHLVGNDRYAIAMAARGDSYSNGYEVWSGPFYYRSNTGEAFTPSGTLQNAVPVNTSVDNASLTIAVGGIDLDALVSTDDAGRIRGDNLLVIGNEIMAWKTVTANLDGTYTITGVWRAVLDTIPQAHSAGARVWFLSFAATLTTESPLPPDALVVVKCLPISPRGVVAIDDVSSVSLLTDERAKRPNPPGKVQINGLYYPATTLNDAILTWAHRNRIQQKADLQAVLPQSAASVSDGPEGGVRVKRFVGGVEKEDYGVLDGGDPTTITYTAADRVADDADGSKSVYFELTPEDAFTGTVRTTEPFVMTGLGMVLGDYLGGVEA